METLRQVTSRGAQSSAVVRKSLGRLCRLTPSSHEGHGARRLLPHPRRGPSVASLVARPLGSWSSLLVAPHSPHLEENKTTRPECSARGGQLRARSAWIRREAGLSLLALPRRVGLREVETAQAGGALPVWDPDHEGGGRGAGRAEGGQGWEEGRAEGGRHLVGGTQREVGQRIVKRVAES